MMNKAKADDLIKRIVATTFEGFPAPASPQHEMVCTILFRLMLAKVLAQGSVARHELKAISKDAGDLADYIDLHEEGRRLIG